MPYKDPILAKTKALERSRRWNTLHPEKRRAVYRRWLKKHPKRAKMLLKKSYLKHREKRLVGSRKWKQDNKDRVKAYKRAYSYKKYHSDPCYRLLIALRTRLRIALNGNKKEGKTLEFLGCSLEHLKRHLESKFLPGMTWKNWSRTGWHIDHIKPLSRFDLSDRNEVLKACHFTNLQPLWAEDNLRKNNRTSYDKNFCSVDRRGSRKSEKKIRGRIGHAGRERNK